MRLTFLRSSGDRGLTDRVRKVLRLAQEEARARGQPEVGTEHLLLGIIQEGQGVASALLTHLNVDAGDLKRRAEASTPRGTTSHDSHELPLSLQTDQAIRFAAAEASALGHRSAGTDHLLLGLLHHESTPASSALTSLGLNLHEVRAAARHLHPPDDVRSGDRRRAPPALFLIAGALLIVVGVLLLLR